jgi:hypothetical protein
MVHASTVTAIMVNDFTLPLFVLSLGSRTLAYPIAAVGTSSTY